MGISEGSGLVPPHSFLVRVGGAEGRRVLQGEETTWAKAWGWSRQGREHSLREGEESVWARRARVQDWSQP